MQKEKLNIINLGCRLNIYEGEVIKSLASKNELDNFTIINSCAVTQKAEKKVTDTKTNDQITIDDIMENIKQKGFEETAIQFSSSPNSQEGGKLGWINESEFSEALLKFIKNTKVGKVTKPIPVPGGILIIKVENIRTKENEIDIENFIDFIISEIYYANSDWPCNNYKMWKTNDENSKWRFLIYDLDLSFGYNANSIYNTASIEHATYVSDGWPHCECSNILFRQMSA